MTVAELIAKLSEYDLQKEVSVKVYDQYNLTLFENVVAVKQEVLLENYEFKTNIVLAITDEHSDSLNRLRPREDQPCPCQKTCKNL